MQLPQFALWILLATAPQIDGPATLTGATLVQDDREVLPHARHTADVVDAMLLGASGAQVSGAGIDLFDPIRLAAHGRSVTQLQLRWGEVDITDPARPGQPLVDLPVAAWEELTLNDLWTDRPGLAFATPTNVTQGGLSHPYVSVQGAMGGFGGGQVGGGSWWPNGWFDREIAQRYGAPSARRALSQARESELRLVVPMHRGSLFILGERLEHRHRYLTTPVDEQASRDTGVLATTQQFGAWPISLRLAYQGRHRDQDGGQDRFDAATVQDVHSEAWLMQTELSGPVAANVRLHLALGGGGRTDAGANGVGPAASFDVADTWLQLSRYRRPETLRRWHSSARVCLAFTGPPGPATVDYTVLPPPRPHVHLIGSAVVSGWSRDPTSQRLGERFGGAGISMEVMEGQQRGALGRHQLRLGSEGYLPLGEPRRALDVSAGVDLTGITDSSGVLTQAVGPSAGAALRWRVGNVDTFVMLRREPEAITAQVGDFLGAQGPQGSVYAWDDRNGDALPDPQEMGARLGGFGASAHSADSALRRPSHTHLAFGGRSPPWRGFRLGVRSVGHLLHDRYEVRAAGADAPAVATTFADPGGDGRGEARATGGGQRLTVYAEPRVPTRFELANSKALSLYGGVEVELRSEPRSWGFLHVLGTAYMSRGDAPQGSFADRNDPGVIGEASARRNNRLHARGRYDHDRAYGLKVLGGLRPVAGLSLGLAARYRDGQPFTRVVVDPSLPQGPTALMAVARGQVRHTAWMTWDLRLRYESQALRPLGATLTADVYNLLNSATEVAEDPRTGPGFRRALEASPGRAVWVGVALAFLP